MDTAAIAEFFNSFWLVWLIVLFAGIVYWAFRPKNKSRFESDARIPFRDGDRDDDNRH